MAAVIIPADTIVCGHPWARWVEQATKYFTKYHNRKPSVDDVRDFIERHEYNRAWEDRMFTQGAQMDADQHEQLRLQEIEFRELLRVKFPHLYTQYTQR